MTAKHTPGPWAITRSDASGRPYQIRSLGAKDGPGAIVDVTRWAFLNMPSSPEAEANARLIAAAPDMLAALKALADEYNDPALESEGPAYRSAIAAIAKAEASE